MPAVSVVIPVRNGGATLGRTLDALAAQDLDLPYEVIVVDNVSTDSSGLIARGHPIGAQVIRRDEPAGPGIARNVGAAAARADVLAFTDADCEPDPGWLAAGLGALDGADLVQGRVLPTPGVPVGPFDRSLWVTVEHGLYETANAFVGRRLFEELGGFEDYVRADEEHAGRIRSRVPARPFGEDAWFAWRARRAGARTTYCESATVHHAVFPGDAKQFVAERVRNRLFPHLVRRIPELRDVFLWRGLFLNRRTAAFDLAALGAIVAVLRRRPVPLAAALPYVWLVRGEVKTWGWTGRKAWKLGAAITAADAVGCAALAVGTVEARTPVL